MSAYRYPAPTQQQQYTQYDPTMTSNPFAEFEATGTGGDEVDDDYYKTAIRDHILFCIDASSSMQRPLPDSYFPSTNDDPEPTTEGKGKSPLHLALEVVLSIQRKKILTGPSDSVGVLIYNIDNLKIPSEDEYGVGSSSQSQQKQSSYRNGTSTFLPLRQLSSESIKHLKSILEEADADLAEQASAEELKGERRQPEILGRLFPAMRNEDGVDTAEVFEACNHVFRDAGTKILGLKRIFLVTNNDKPERLVPIPARSGGIRGSQGRAGGAGAYMDTRGPARTRFSDLRSLGVEIEPFFIDTPERGFDQTIYWDDIFLLDPDDFDPTDEDDYQNPPSLNRSAGLEGLREIMETQVTKRTPKRVLFSVPMKLGEGENGIVIGVNGYAMIAPANKPGYKYYDLSGRKAQEAKTKTVYHGQASGDRVNPEEIATAYFFGTGDEPFSIESNFWASAMNEDGEQAEAAAGGAGGKYDSGVGEMDVDEDDDKTEDENEEGEEDSGAKATVKPEKKETVEDPKVEKKPEMVIRTRIQFTEAEIKEFRSLNLDPQIKIIGFHDPENLRFDQNVKHSVFIYPNETHYAGSTRTFAALLASCMQRKRYALALAVTRKSATPVMCCLIPQEEVILPNGEQDKPPGFHMILLPYADDIRSKPDKIREGAETCTDEQRDQMSKIIRKLTLKGQGYQSEAYPNPTLSFFYAKLQSLAFEEPFEPDNLVDPTKPNTDNMHQAAGDLLRDFNESVSLDERVGRRVQVMAGTKRGNDDVQVDERRVIELYNARKLNDLTVKEIKSYAKDNHIVVTGLKADCLAAILPHVERVVKEKAAGNKKPKS